MNEFLKGILDGINVLFGNYGWSIIVFTVLIRVVLFPFDYKSRVSMRKTTKIQPQMAALQKKYANDKEKLNKKMAELYKKEHINPLSGCLPVLLTMPILFAMFAAMRMIAEEGRGVVVLIRDLNKTIPFEGEVSPHTLRQYGLGAQILSTLGLHELILLTNSAPLKVIGLDAYGLSIAETRPITKE